MQHKTRGLSKHLQRLFPDSWNGFDVGRRRLTEPVLCNLNSTAFSRHPTIFCIKGRCGWARTKDESFTTLCEARCCGVDARSCHLVHKCKPRHARKAMHKKNMRPRKPYLPYLLQASAGGGRLVSSCRSSIAGHVRPPGHPSDLGGVGG